MEDVQLDSAGQLHNEFSTWLVFKYALAIEFI